MVYGPELIRIRLLDDKEHVSSLMFNFKKSVALTVDISRHGPLLTICDVLRSEIDQPYIASYCIKLLVFTHLFI
jgi:hypothetical protein